MDGYEGVAADVQETEQFRLQGEQKAQQQQTQITKAQLQQMVGPCSVL
jgi:hypothetical protein